MAEYISREAIEFPYMTMSLWGLNADTCKAYNEGVKAAEDAVAAIPAADVVPRAAYEQAAWERDIAMEQLEEHGILIRRQGRCGAVVRKPVKGYEGYYEVDQFGRVFSVDRVISVEDNGRKYDKPIAGKQMKQTMHDKGYKVVSLTKGGKTKNKFVHRLVAEAFLDNPDDLPMVNHKDEDKTNNFLENLEWCTASYNRTYGKAVERHARTLRGKKHTDEHKQKISAGLKKHYAGKDDFCSYGEKGEEDGT